MMDEVSNRSTRKINGKNGNIKHVSNRLIGKDDVGFPENSIINMKGNKLKLNSAGDIVMPEKNGIELLFEFGSRDNMNTDSWNRNKSEDVVILEDMDCGKDVLLRRLLSPKSSARAPEPFRPTDSDLLEDPFFPLEVLMGDRSPVLSSATPILETKKKSTFDPSRTKHIVTSSSNLTDNAIDDFYPLQTKINSLFNDHCIQTKAIDEMGDSNPLKASIPFSFEGSEHRKAGFLNDGSKRIHIGSKPIKVRDKSGNIRSIRVLDPRRRNMSLQLALEERAFQSLKGPSKKSSEIMDDVLNPDNENSGSGNMFSSPRYKYNASNFLKSLLNIDEVREFPNQNQKIRMGRPPKSQIIQTSQQEKEPKLDVIVARTRSGRLSKLPRRIVRDYKQLKHGNDSCGENETDAGYTDYTPAKIHKDSNIGNEQGTEKKLFGPLKPKQRKFSSHSICPTCGKVYLGYKRMSTHFNKYPQHRNEEFLNEIRSMQKEDSEPENNGTENFTDDNNSANTAAAKNVMKKKRTKCKNCSFKASCKTAAITLKKILSSYDPMEVVKCAGPIVTSMLNMWQLLLMRTKQLKQDGETLAEVLLKEISLMLQEVRGLSDQLIKPLISEHKQNRPHNLMIGNKDILKHVLGVLPGAYTTNENDAWANDLNMENYTKKLPKNTKLTDGSPLDFKSDIVGFSTGKLANQVKETFDSPNKWQFNNIGNSCLESVTKSHYDLTKQLPECRSDNYPNFENSTFRSSCENVNLTNIDIINSENATFFESPTREPVNFHTELLPFSSARKCVTKENNDSLLEISKTNNPLLGISLNSSDYISDFTSDKTVSNDTEDMVLPHFDAFSNNSDELMSEFAASLPLLSDSVELPSRKRRSSSTDEFFNTLKHLDSNAESMIEQLNAVMSSSSRLINDGKVFQPVFNNNSSTSSSPTDMLDFSSLCADFHSSH